MQDTYYLISNINSKLGNVLATGADHSIAIEMLNICSTVSTFSFYFKLLLIFNTEICLAV